VETADTEEGTVDRREVEGGTVILGDAASDIPTDAAEACTRARVAPATASEHSWT